MDFFARYILNDNRLDDAAIKSKQAQKEKTEADTTLSNAVSELNTAKINKDDSQRLLDTLNNKIDSANTNYNNKKNNKDTASNNLKSCQSNKKCKQNWWYMNNLQNILNNANNELKTATTTLNNLKGQYTQRKNNLTNLTTILNQKTNDYNSALSVSNTKTAEKNKADSNYNTILEIITKKYGDNTKYINVEKYTLTIGSTQSCGFYFKITNFNCIYSNINKNVSKYIEDYIINNDYNYCFNVDNSNKLYSIINNDPILYSLTDTNTKEKYPIQFKLLEMGHFVDCLLKFIQNCIKISTLKFELDSKNKTMKLYILDKTCIIYFNNFDIYSENSNIESNIKKNNIQKITYLGKEIDLNKNYKYGQLYYTISQYYDCIVINN